MDVIRMQADELVREARLKAIEREHRSKGSILDTRELHKIVNPPLYDEILRKSTNKKAANRTVVAAIEDAAADPGMDNKTSTIPGAGDFKLEEQLWKTKSVDTESVQKRRYENPELHKFRESMTPQQKAIFKEKIIEGVHSLALKYREEMTTLKKEMDRSGVFHPAANAHRAHCMYLMKLNKGFSVETIEVPILRSLKAEELIKERHEAYEEEKRARLIKLATEGKTSDKEILTSKLVDSAPIIEAEVFDSKEAKRTRTQLAEPKPSQHSELAEKVIAYKNSLRPEIDEKEKILMMLMGPNRAKAKKKSIDKKTLPAMKSVPRILPPVESPEDAHHAKGVTGLMASTTPKLRQTKSTSSMGATGPEKPNGASQATPSKLERGDTAEFLDEMAASSTDVDGDISDNGSSNSGMRAGGDKSSIHSKSAMSVASITANDRVMFMKIRRGKLGPADPRMLLVDDANRLDQSEVANLRKVKERSDILDEQISSWMIYNMQQNQIEKITDGSAFLPSDYDEGREVGATSINGGFSPQRLHSRSLRSPQTLVPFDDFFSMFNNHIAHVEEEKHAAVKVTADMDEPQSPVRGRRTLVSGDAHAPVVATMTGTEAQVDHVKKTDIVQILAKKDPEFEKFTKQHGKARPMSEIIAKSNAKMTQPRRMRIITPLGRDAVVLEDSNGKALKYASKGFTNHFKHIVIEGHDENAPKDLHEGSSVSQASAPSGVHLSADSEDANASVASKLAHDGAPGEFADGERPASAWTPSKTHRRDGRSRAGRSVKGAGDVGGEEQDMQAKLVATWQTIELSSHKRLWFMQKYSTDTFAAELGRATDLWAEAAVYIVARIHTLKLTNKLLLGYCVMPVLAEELVTAFTSHLHPLLSSRSSGLVPHTLQKALQRDTGTPSAPPSSGTVSIGGLDEPHHVKHSNNPRRRSLNRDNAPPQVHPLSSLAVDVVLHAIQDAFAFCDGSAPDTETAKSCLQTVGKMIDGCLLKSVRRAQEELEDVVYYGDTVVKEWMMTTTLW